MSTNTIDTTALVQAVRDIAAESPDFKYETDPLGSCHYARDGKPSCIVGQAFHRLGVSVGELAEFDIAYGGVEQVLRRHYGIDRTAEAWWLTRVQNRQDEGRPWGTAVALADQSAPL